MTHSAKRVIFPHTSLKILSLKTFKATIFSNFYLKVRYFLFLYWKSADVRVVKWAISFLKIAIFSQSILQPWLMFETFFSLQYHSNIFFFPFWKSFGWNVCKFLVQNIFKSTATRVTSIFQKFQSSFYAFDGFSVMFSIKIARYMRNLFDRKTFLRLSNRWDNSHILA